MFSIFTVRSASLSDTGKVREINEDAVLESGNLYAVADGMGGHRAGEIASSLALSAIQQYVEDSIGLLPGDKLIEKAVQSANAIIHNKSKSDESFRSMGTTLTALYREGNTAFIAHVGDSRAYLLRKGKLRRLTTDHSLVQKLIDEGDITEEEARKHPQRNIILRALGIEPRVEVEIISINIEPGDKFLLATDGLTALVGDEEIEEIISREQEPEKAARSLVNEALARGGTDNVSVVLVEFGASEGRVFPQEPSDTSLEYEGQVEECARDIESGIKLPEKRKSRFLKILGVLVIAFLVLFSAGGWFLWKNCYFVGISGKKVVIFQGFPFWGLAREDPRRSIGVELLSIEDEKMLRKGVSVELSYTEALERFREYEGKAITIPDVINLRGDKALKKIKQCGLKPIIHPFFSRLDLKKTFVKKQEPRAGRKLGRGRSVKLILEIESPGKIEPLMVLSYVESSGGGQDKGKE